MRIRVIKRIKDEGNCLKWDREEVLVKVERTKGI